MSRIIFCHSIKNSLLNDDVESNIQGKIIFLSEVKVYYGKIKGKNTIEIFVLEVELIFC